MLQLIKLLSLLKWLIETIMSGYRLLRKRGDKPQCEAPLSKDPQEEEPQAEETAKESFHKRNGRF